MNKLSAILFLLIIFITAIPAISNAQTTDFLILSINPENPRPLQNIELTVKSYIIDINRAKITWSINSEVRKTDIGLKTFNTVAGKAGETTNIKVQAETTEGELYEIEAYFTPAEVNIIYESLSYTPPFYKGKTLNPNQGLVLVAAIPELVNSNGQKIPKQNLIYNWKRNGKVEESNSGIGKDFFVYSGTIPVRDSLIEVVVSSIDGEISASRMINISHDQAKIVFYEDNPIYGIMFNRGIKNSVRLLADEFKIRAIPYFTTVGYTASPDLDYKWSINGNSIGNLENDKSAMVFRQEGEGSGTAKINLKLENNSRIFQFTENSFSLNFEK